MPSLNLSVNPLNAQSEEPITDQTDHRTILHELLHCQTLTESPTQIDDGPNRNCYDVGCVENLARAGAAGAFPPWTVAASYEYYAFAVRAQSCVRPRQVTF